MLLVLFRITVTSCGIPLVLSNRPFGDVELAAHKAENGQPLNEAGKLGNFSLLSVNETRSSVDEARALLDAAKEKMQKGLEESLQKAKDEDKKYQELRDELTKGLDEFSQSAASLQVRMPEEQIKKLKDFGKIAGITELLETKDGGSSEKANVAQDSIQENDQSSSPSQAAQVTDGQPPHKNANLSLAQVKKESTKHRAKVTQRHSAHKAHAHSSAHKAHTHRATSKKLHTHGHAANAHGKTEKTKRTSMRKHKNVHKKSSFHRKTSSKGARVGLIETHEHHVHAPSIDAAEAADALG